MKKVRQWQRSLFLCLFCITVLAPIVFVSRRLKVISPLGRKEFLEESRTIRYNKDDRKLNLIEQEDAAGLKEPKIVVYEDKRFDSIVSFSNANSSYSVDSTDAGDIGDHLQTNGTTQRSSGEDEQVQKLKITSISEKKEKLNQIVPENVHDSSCQQHGPADAKVKKIRDQLIRAKAYLHFAPAGSNSHFVKELQQRIKELERGVGDASKDSELSRSALQRSRAMEASLSKASHLYPDCSSMATKLRAMAYNAEEQLRLQQNQATYLVQLAARTTPKGHHCLAMRLTAEYLTLEPDERKLPHQHRVHNQDLHHYAVFSDNVLACAVVVNSAVSSALEPEKMVFHVVTDLLNFPAISMWFLQNPPGEATLDIQSMHDFDWLATKYSSALQSQNASDPRFTSALNHLRFYLPDVFPKLNKILLFDHDVVVQRDLSELWSINMMGKVNGAVATCRKNQASFRRMDMLINFSDPLVYEKYDANACTWAFGMNIFDLQEWRRQDLTAFYSRLLELGFKRPLWKAGSLPLGWLTFYNNTVLLDRRWHTLGLGYESGVSRNEIGRAAVIHYDGVMKPWLEIGISKYKGYWSKHVLYSHPFLQQCNIHE